jgi:hypothetical protein
MNIYEKAGDLLIDIAKLIIGGVILSAIMIGKNDTDATTLYLVGTLVSIAFIAIGFMLYRLYIRKSNDRVNYFHINYRAYWHNCRWYCYIPQQKNFVFQTA